MNRLNSKTRIAATLSAVFGVAMQLVGCGDFGLEPDRIPQTLLLEPSDTLVTEGDHAQLRITVLDQDGEPFPGVPSWAPPYWSYSEQGAVVVGPDGRLEALGGGEIQVEAALGGLKAWSNVRINPGTTALSAPAAYLIQAAQNTTGDVPIVAGRRALLRVFVTSNPGSFYQPRGRATFFLDGDEIHATPLLPSSYVIPTDVDESRIDRSFNAVIPGSALQPGVEMVLELDVDGIVPLAPGSQIRVPEVGRRALDVRALPRMALVMVPVLLESDPNPQIFGWTNGLTPSSAKLRFARSVLPIGDFDVEVHDTYTTSADLTTAEGWRQFLREVALLRTTEGMGGYYYGAVILPQGSQYGGLGYVGGPASVGAPSERTLAHELGHNMSLQHAPCGGVASWDSNYPHDGGFTGVWGYDFTGGSGLGALMDPDQFKDLMGYCQPRWISDYHFKKALRFRAEQEPLLETTGPAGNVILLWGGADGGDLLLEPSFLVEASSAIPDEDGPYHLEGRDQRGRSLFSLHFPMQDDSRGGGHFSFAVPLAPALAESLAEITLTGPEGTVTVDGSSFLPPMALVTDPATGRIRAIRRGGPVASDLLEGAAVTVSRGLPTVRPDPR